MHNTVRFRFFGLVRQCLVPFLFLSHRIHHEVRTKKSNVSGYVVFFPTGTAFNFDAGSSGREAKGLWFSG